MPLFDQSKAPFSYEVIKEGDEVTLNINCENYIKIPSIEDDPITMSKTCDMLIEVPNVTKIVFYQKRNYEYEYSQVVLLQEIAKLYNQLIKRKDVVSYNALIADQSCIKYVGTWYAELRSIVSDLLRTDPLGAYVELRRIQRREKIREETVVDQNYARCEQKFIAVIAYIAELLDKTRLVNMVKPFLSGYKLGDREIYRRIFKPTIKPDFMFTKLMATYPMDAEEIDSYTIGDDTEITIFELPETIQYLYHMIPPEFKLTEEEYDILDTARKILAEHKPKKSEFVDPERMRQVFFNVGSDLIDELVSQNNLRLNSNDINKLTNILVRYTVGFGLIEVLLQDEKIQDITINSPIGNIPLFIVHQEYDECKTNILPTRAEAESWASKLKLISGRPLDEANPILDTELSIPGADARVAVISPPLDPTGLAYALRRHRDKPWTLPLFMKNRMINPLAAGVLSFIIDGSRTLLVAGTRSAGKTSLLGSLISEIMRKYRIITIEDSVTQDSVVFIRRNGKVERTTIGRLVDDIIKKYGYWYNLTEHEVTGNPENIEVLAMNKNGKIILNRASKFIRHKVRKPVFEIETRTGRKIKVTGDHSLFGIDEEGKITEIKVSNLKIKDFIAVPRKIDIFSMDLENIEFLEEASSIEGAYFSGLGIKRLNERCKDEIKRFGKEQFYHKATISNWFKKSILPAKILKSIIDLGYCFDETEIFFSYKNSLHRIPIKFPIGEKFLVFVGLWIADGSYDKNSVIISANDIEDRKIVEDTAKKLGLRVRFHSDKVSYMLHSETLKVFMREILKLKGDAYTKRIPNWVFNLSKRQISFVLNGIFSGDGCPSDKEVVIPLSSINLLKDLQFLLTFYGIVLRIGTLRKDNTYNASISNLKSWKSYKENIGFLQEYKQKKLDLLCNKVSTHDTTDVIPLKSETKKNIRGTYKNLNYHDYVIRNNNIGREKLTAILKLLPKNNELLDNLAVLIRSDIFWDQIKSIKMIEYEGYVYDISVPECESFICDNIVAHNTLELPCSAFRKLGYNIQSMKVASALTRGTSEVSADEGIRTTLRLGDSCLIVGEVRSVEARALYEAMRVGALANVVMGTIHGDSPYGVFDRVVNDLNVPKTSFKATDIIVVANPIRSADGLHRWRRVTQITEVRKHWEHDPLLEHGFVDLLKYETKTDQLEPSQELLNGESEIIKAIAGNIKEWAGNWDAVWDNILLRAKLKETLLNYSESSNKPELLEAPFVIRCNDEYHRIADKVKEELGSLDSKRIFFEWDEWLKRHIKKGLS